MPNENPVTVPARKAVMKRTAYDISAQSSLWFCWAPTGFVGPKGEGAASKPIFDFKPQGATQVTITVEDTTQRWGHSPDPTRASGANGLDGSNGTVVDSRGLEMPEYQSATYHSENIDSISTHLNRLVMILEHNGAAPTSGNRGKQELLGETPHTFACLSTVTGIFIGMHDGHEWNNNTGSIRVSVQWL